MTSRARPQPAARHGNLIASIPDSIHRISGDFRFLEFYPGVGVKPPLPPEEFLGRTFDEVLSRDLAELHKSAIAEAFRTGTVVKRRFTITIDGKIRTRECRYVPLENNEIMAIVRELTDEGPEARNPDVIDAIPDIVFRISADFRYLDFLPGRAGLKPYVPPETFLGRTIDEIMPKDIAALSKSGIVEALTTAKIVTLRYTLQVEGEPRRYETKIVPCEGSEVLAFVRDCTDASLTNVVKSLPDTIHRISADLRFLEFYPGAEVQPPLPPEEALGRTLDEVLPRDEAELHKSAIAEALATGRIVKRRFTETIDGKIRLRECRYVPVENNEIIAIVRELTDDRPDASLTNFVKAIPDPIVRISADFRFLECHPGVGGLQTGLPTGEFLGRTIDEVLPRDLAELHKSGVVEALSTGRIARRTYTVTIEGETQRRECRYVPLENDEIMAIVRELTDEGPEAGTNFVKSPPESIYRISGDEFRFLEFYPGVGVQPPRPPEEFLDRTMDEVMPKHVAELHKSAIAEALGAGTIVKVRFTITIDGKMRSRECRYVPLENNEIIALVRDLTDEDPEARNPDVIDAIPDMVFRVSGDFRYLDFLPGHAGLQPLVPPEEFLGRTIDEILPPDVAELHKSGVAEALSTGKPVTMKYTLKVEGEPRRYECRIVPCEGNEVLAFVRDCTDDRPEASTNLIKAIPDPIVRVSADFRFLEFHPGGGGILTWIPPEEFLGRTIDEVIPRDLAELHKSAIAEALSTGRIARRTYSVTIEGETQWRECRYVPLENNEVIGIVRDFTDERSGAGDEGQRRDFVAVRDSYGLSPRELAVLQLMVEGVTDKDIAARLRISVYTVNKHVASVLAKMEAESRTEAAVRALREHLCE